MNTMAELLVFISSGLLIPCVACLLILFYQSIARAAYGWRYYRQQNAHMDALVEWIHSADKSLKAPEEKENSDFGRCFTRLLEAGDRALASHLVSEYESLCERSLSATARLAKLGPLVGLLGTLIPMGPALDGLAKGDIAQLAGQMQVAFTTTVIGLLIGGVGLVLLQVERQLVSRQLAALDYLCDTRGKEVMS